MLIKEFVKKYVPPSDTDSLLKTGIVFILGWVKLTNADGLTKTALSDMPVPENLVTLMSKINEAGFYENLSNQLNDIVGNILDKMNQIESGTLPVDILTESPK